MREGRAAGDGPAGKDRAGHVRTKHRIEWWKTYPRDAPTIVFGHYALKRQADAALNPQELWLGPGANAACLDYGVAKGGPLLALRMPERKFVIQDRLDHSGPDNR